MSTGQINVLNKQYLILNEKKLIDDSFKILGFDKKNSQPVTIIKFPKMRFKNEIKEIKLEKKFCKENLMHKNLVQIFNYNFESASNYYYIEEYCYLGKIQSLLNKFYKEYMILFSQKMIKYVVIQILETLDYLFTNDIKHSDLNISNIMITYSNFENLFNSKSKNEDIFVLKSNNFFNKRGG